MTMNATRIGAAGILALLLAGGAGGALAAPAEDPPRPVPSGAELSVRPGERVIVTTEALRYGYAFSGVRVTSPAFAADGTLRMDGDLLKAVATVSCTAEPGSYEVRFASPVGNEDASKINRLWGGVRVAPADAAERADCARQVAARPPESMEERYPAGTQWPAGPWDVRTVQAGGQLRAKDGMEKGNDGEVELTSPGFTQPVVMHGDKMVTATVRIRCAAEPGLYVVHWNEKGMPAREWARYRVTAAAPDCQDPAAAPQASAVRRTAPWLIGGAAALAAAGAVGYALFRRRRDV
ncbi:hypothetical protein [Streptomyces sp. NBC_01207]|uniref:hypothetical protein n=1 Tax=Streptomyces sp. NBC_01207 TaxID=2903772 RepID=UPI002E0E5A7C|nr:hypothetical protein OG457_12705 [Streptomyces sp. NBC_01207]